MWQEVSEPGMVKKIHTGKGVVTEKETGNIQGD